MDKQLANKIIKDITFGALETLKEYIEYKRQDIYRVMETADPEDTRFLQGKLYELRQLEKIRDIAVAVKDKK